MECRKNKRTVVWMSDRTGHSSNESLPRLYIDSPGLFGVISNHRTLDYTTRNMEMDSRTKRKPQL